MTFTILKLTEIIQIFRSFGSLETLVAGTWGDLSDDFHEMLKLMLPIKLPSSPSMAEKSM